MKILVGIGALDGCAAYRLIYPCLALRDRGHDITFIDKPEELEAPDADVLIVQRLHSIKVLEKLRAFQTRGGKVIFDLDDNVWSIPASNPAARIFGEGKPATRMMEQYIEAADAVVVSTPALKRKCDQLRGYNIRDHASDPKRATWIAYNSLEASAFERYARKPDGRPKRSGEIRIGWAGSDTHRGDFVRIIAALSKVMREHPETRMVFIGADMTDLMPQDLKSRCRQPIVGTTWEAQRKTKPVSQYFPPADDPQKRMNSLSVASEKLPTRKWYALLEKSAIDIALAPLEPIAFNDSKSFVKLLEYGMLGLPTIASAFGPYMQYGVEAFHMGEKPLRLAETPDDWADHLRALIESPDARRTLAESNLREVGERHLLATNAVQWESILNFIAQETVAA